MYLNVYVCVPVQAIPKERQLCGNIQQTIASTNLCICNNYCMQAQASTASTCMRVCVCV